jgi:tetratricopeptide (TPR) repeat protein
VLALADLGRGDPEVAAIVDGARRQFLAQQAHAIDVQVKLGQCVRARELATAARQVVPDDTTLEPRARACKPHAAPAEPAPTLAAATEALEHGDLARALAIAEKLVAASPDDAAAARIAVLAACALKDVDRATRLAARLRGADRSEVRAQCEEHHIDIAGAPGAGNGSGKPHPDEPGEPGESTELAEAQSAARAGDWPKALSAAEAALRRTPRNLAALRIGVVAACHLRDESTARSLLRRVPLGRQRMLRQECARQGVLI